VNPEQPVLSLTGRDALRRVRKLRKDSQIEKQSEQRKEENHRRR
jgi:hypothetical protein